ncbi:MAG: AsmA family protein [Pseudomonadota bacterium]
MNRFFLFVGTLLLVVLTAALVAPRYIDWSNYTAVIEQQASRLLGRDVHVSGAVDLRLLPMPRLTFTDVEIASQTDGSEPEVRVQRMRALMSLAPFLRGQAEIVELALESPVIRLSALDAGSSERSDAVDLAAISIEEAVVSNGRIERLTGDGSVQVLVSELNARLSAPSILGPWRVDPASAVIAGKRVELRVNSGTYAGDRRMRTRVSVMPVNRPLEITVDGFFDWSEDQARFEGQSLARSLNLSEDSSDVSVDASMDVATLDWRLEGTIDASLAELVARDVELTLGQGGDQAFVLTGHARTTLGEDARFSAALSSRQIDLDRTLGGGATEPVSLGAGWAAAGDLVRSLERLDLPGDLTFDIPAIVINSAVIRQIGFDATYRPGQPVDLRSLEATFPGETAFGFSGAIDALETGGLRLDGGMSLRSNAPGLFIAWSTGRADEEGAFSQLSALDVAGRLIADARSLRLERLRGSIDGSALTGSAAYQLGPKGRDGGAALTLELDAGRFDFGLLSGLGRWVAPRTSDPDEAGNLALGTIDASLKIDALVAGNEDLGGVEVDVNATPDRLRVDRLQIGDAAGARLSASGFFDRSSVPPLGEFSVQSELERIGGVVRLARDVLGDSPFLADLQRNSGLYEPANLTGTYSNSASAGLQLGLVGSLAETTIDLNGTVPDGGSQFAASRTVQESLQALFERASEIRLNAEAEDGFALVGQLGVPALPSELEGPGSLRAVFTGAGDGPPTVRLAFDGLDVTARLDADLVRGADETVSGLSGTGSVFAGDIAQLGLMAGLALPGLFDPIAASMGFDIAYDSNSRRADLSALTGLVDDISVAGEAALTVGPLNTLLDADVSIDRVDLQTLASAFIGPAAFDVGFADGWPEGPFAFNPWPIAINLKLDSPRIALWDGLTVLNGALDLKASTDELEVERLSGQLLGGDLDTRLVLRDADRGGLLNGRVGWQGFELDQLSWERGGGPVLRGEGALSLSFESAGNSVASLMSALTGEGTLALADATLSGLGLNGFARILQAADAGLLGEGSDLEAAFADALQAGTMRIERADTPVSVVAGVARASNLFLGGDQTAMRGGFTVDLGEQVVDADFSYAATDGPGDVAAMPNVGLSFTGDLAAPERTLDVAQVASFLNVRQLESEIRRVEALNAEILERESLLRVMGAEALDAARARQLIEIERERQVREEAEEEARRQAEEAAERARAEAEQAAAQDGPQLDLSLPPLGEPIVVDALPFSNAVPASEQPATGAPLDLTPN